ncbi:MAG: acyl-CoA dehydratase activase [Armatimonadota bacterium]|jgi:predicted CoA-substrate-specific enzyme activase
MLTAGVDIGSLATKAVILDPSGCRVVAAVRIPSGARPPAAGRSALEQALAAAECTREDLQMIVATGYGRDSLDFADSTVTEISCAARGAHLIDGRTRTVVDIGGQDSKAIRVDAEGYPLDFALNDRCAAGTGRFLEVMAGALETDVNGLERLAREAAETAEIARTCTVFAESEVVGLLAAGTDRGAVAAGLCRAVALRTSGLVRQVGVEPRVMLIGGVGKNAAIAEDLGEVLNTELLVPDDPQIVVAIGAAVVAAERARQALTGRTTEG